jgi:hypothetical protein
MSIDEFGWITINILIPIFLPLLGVLPFKMMPLPEGVEVRFISLVKDGQWCWTAICIGASSLYELWVANSQNLVVSGSAEVLIFFNAFLIALSICLASGGAVFSTPILNKNYSYREWFLNYRLMLGSFFLVSFISIISFLIHIALVSLTNNSNLGK